MNLREATQSPKSKASWSSVEPSKVNESRGAPLSYPKSSEVQGISSGAPWSYRNPKKYKESFHGIREATQNLQKYKESLHGAL